MLPPLRALAHAPRRPVFARIAHICAQRLYYSVAVARPNPIFFFDAAEERTQPRSPGANSLRNYATFSQTLQQLVEEERYELAGAMLSDPQRRGVQVHPHPVYVKAAGNLLSKRPLGEKDYEVLVHWLELLPDARRCNPSLLHDCLDDIRHHAKADSAFIRSTGQVLAQKGYKGLVEDEILPLARASLDNETFTLFEQEMSRLLADSISRISSTSASGTEHSEVFEDASEDYASVMAASAPPPPSVLELVETTLPQILPAPAANGQSVFEDSMDEDYLFLQPNVHHAPRQSPADQLLRLVKDAKYDNAYHLLRELEQLQFKISFSHAYGTAALEALRRPLSEDFTPEDQMCLFATWFSFIPPAHESSGATSLQDIQRTIMQSSMINIPLVLRFCFILVEKGYTSFVGGQEVALVMRFAPPGEAVSFIRHLEEANSSYWSRYYPDKADFEVGRFSGQLRSRAIRNLAYAGKIEEAITLLPGEDSKIQLSAYSCNRLLRAIFAKKDPSFVEYIPRIEQLAAADSNSGHREELRKLHAEAEEKTMALQLQTSSADVGAGASLPDTLRYLKWALRKADNHPHSFVIVEFLEQYFGIGRTRAPTLLLNLTINTSHRSMSIFLFAEMTYYRRIGQHHLIIQTFVDHFYLSGVPREEVLKVYNETQRLQTQNHSNLNSRLFSPDDNNTEGDRASLTRICDPFATSALPRGKAWPMKIHCNLVWHALVALTPTHSKLENLYEKLLSLGRGHDAVHSPTNHPIEIRPLLPPPSWRQAIDHAAFTPFMRRLMLARGPHRGTRIISDMVELGIQPSIYHYTELAGFLARCGEIQAVMSVLNTLEQTSGLCKRLARQKHDSSHLIVRGLATVSTESPPQIESLDLDSPPPSDHSDSQVQTAPEPDLVFYVSILRGFLLSESFEGFQKAHARLQALRELLPNKRFYKDQDEILNQVYTEFRYLSKRHGYDFKKERKAKFKEFMTRVKAEKK